MMKHRIIPHVLFCAAVLSFLASCEKNVRYSTFDGFWQVTSVEDKLTGVVTDPVGRLYISFECDLAKLSYLPEDRNPGFLGYEYVGSYTRQGDSLHFSTFYVYHYTNPQETTEAPADHLAAFGIYRKPSSFALTLSRSNMTLDNESTLIKLRKY